MSGWSGGAANRTWQRDRRGSDDGRLNLQQDIAKILAAFRETHGYQPGMTWDPYSGTYSFPTQGDTA